MKTTGDVFESSYCNVLSQKRRQVFKLLAGVTLLALIVLFDVTSHHEELNPSYMINCAIVKIACTFKIFFGWCHQIKHPPHLWHESLWDSVWSSSWVRLRGGCLRKEPRGSSLPSRQVAITSPVVCGIQGTWNYDTELVLYNWSHISSQGDKILSDVRKLVTKYFLGGKSRQWLSTTILPIN